MNDLTFWKVHGCSNSFLVLVEPEQPLNWVAFSKEILDYNRGVGADGLLVLKASKPDWELIIYNRDGSFGGMSGNGVRCAAHVLRNYLNVPSPIKMMVHGRAITCFEMDGNWEVDMGAATFDPPKVPCRSDTALINANIKISGRTLAISAVSMGNPHCVVVVPDFEQLEIQTWGPILERHEIFPERTNVEFVMIKSRTQLQVQVWERGVGITQACGSGACAVLAALNEIGLCDQQALLNFPGGTLKVRKAENQHLWLSGPVQEICEGKLTGTFL